MRSLSGVKLSSYWRKLQAFLPLLAKLLIILGLMAILFHFARSDLFVVSRISCTTQFGPCERQMEEEMGQFLGTNLFLFNTEQLVRSLDDDFRVRDVSIDKVFPNKLKVTVVIRKPRAALMRDEAGMRLYYLLDEEGILMEVAESTLLPKLSLNEELERKVFTESTLGKKINGEVATAVALVSLVNKITEITSAQLGKDSLVIQLGSGTRSVFPLNRDPAVLAGSLQVIMYKSKIDGKHATEIDLRYSNPVVVYQ